MRKIALLVLLLLIVSGCSAKVANRDEDKAIDVGNKFLKALMNDNYDMAYADFVSDRLKTNVKADDFASTFKANAERRGRITKAVFDSYQPIPDHKAYQLYYNVNHATAGDVMYHLVLEDDGTSGYRVIFVDIGNQMQYPPNTQASGVERIKKDRHIEVTPD